MTTGCKKTVAIIGGGVAGMVAARHLCDPSWGMSPTLFELSDSLGGTWVYTEKTGIDEYGLPIHSSMYKNLRTNLPKEVMMFPDFPHTKQGVSYMSNREILQYLLDYAQHFNIKKCVKFRHYVKDISPYGSQWKIVVIDLKANEERTYIFDAVILANGHNSVPTYPKIEGIQYFRGQTLHSHNYREPDGFRNQSTLLIGAGPSGLDMTFDLSTVSDHVVLSHHTDYASKVGFPPHVVLKPDVERILRDGSVLFKDGSTMEFDVIVYCTGYEYTYPFLSESCGIKSDHKYVTPLYKRLININHPTMAVLGILRHTPIFYLCDLQVRYFLQTLMRPEVLPSKTEMLEELAAEEAALMKDGRRLSEWNLLGEDNAEYMRDICSIAGVPSMPPILLRIYMHGYNKIFSDFKNFRNNFYRIIDQDNFSVVDLREVLARPVVRIHDNPSCRCGALI
uniref:Flavin-containing monooxygenase n=1 Tax=Lygus hesperus TaxID=30085 RepID=A0A146LJS0_LYGHE